VIGRVWALEWRTAAARRRLLAWNVAVPVLLLAPIAFSAAAAPHRAAVYTVFFGFFGAFGTCIPLIRDGRSGWIEKQRLTGYGERRWLVERVVAAAALDGFQLAPAIMLLALASRLPGPDVGAVVAGLALGLLTAALLGAMVAAVVRSLAEGALLCAAVTLAALHLSGVFRPGSAGTWSETAERFGVFRPLADAARVLAGSPIRDAVWPLEEWTEACLALAGVGLVVVALAPLIVRRLGSPAGISR